jgi:hypothetical protein
MLSLLDLGVEKKVRTTVSQSALPAKRQKKATQWQTSRHVNINMLQSTRAGST